MKKGLLFQVIVIILIQAILLTQAESALAAIFNSKDLCREAALKYQKIATSTVSLIFGIGCLQLNPKSLQLEKLFSLLSGSSSNNVENYQLNKCQTISKEIYKAFSLTSIINTYENNQNEILNCNLFADVSDWLSITRQGRAPPMFTKNIGSDFNGRIV